MSRFNPDSRTSNHGGAFSPLGPGPSVALGASSPSSSRRTIPSPATGGASQPLQHPFHSVRRTSSASASAPSPFSSSSSIILSEPRPILGAPSGIPVFPSFSAHAGTHSSSSPPPPSAPSTSPSRASPQGPLQHHRLSFSNTSQTALGSIAGGFAANASRPSSSAGAFGSGSGRAQAWLRTSTPNASARAASQSLPNAMGRMSVGGVESAVSEWTFFGVDFTITNVAALAEESSAGASGSSAAGDLGQRRSSSVVGMTADSEVFSASFGGDRWKLELFRPQDPTLSGSLSMYLSCHLLETSFSPDVIPTQLMIGVREAREQASKRAARDGFVWRQWVDEFCFAHGNEFYETHDFPSLQQLLATNARIRELDAFVLSVQIGSPVGSSLPQIRNAHPVPKPLLSGVQNLIDDEATGDVMICVSERRRAEHDASSGVTFTAHESDITTSSSDSTINPDSSTALDPSPQFRKRVLFAHSGMLKAQSSYFSALLTEGWAETSVATTPGTRKRSIVKIEDFELNTVYWLLHYLYTNEITFQDVEDVRCGDTEELPLGWLGTNPAQMPWSWFTLAEAEKWVDQGKTADEADDDGSLSDIAETESPPPGKVTPLSTKSQGKRRTNNVSIVSTSRPVSKSMPAREEPASPTRSISGAGRISPLFSGPPGRASPTSSRVAASRRSFDGGSTNGAVPQSQHQGPPAEIAAEAKDPHSHPLGPQAPASALSMYRMAHRYCLPELQALALAQIVETLTPRTAFPLLLSTHLWPDLHGAIKAYALAHFEEISADPEFGRCYTEVGEGLWEHGGEVLLDFTRSLAPAAWSS